MDHRLDELIIDLDAFSGPLDLLLALAREHKIDLAHIPMSQLADQYLTFIGSIPQANLIRAAEYMVMASWLVWLKSRLLLPDEDIDDDEPDPTMLADRLALRLRHMDALSKASRRLMALPQKGRDFFGRPPSIRLVVHTRIIPDASLHDLLISWARVHARNIEHHFSVETRKLVHPQQIITTMLDRLGQMENWYPLNRFLPTASGRTMIDRSAMAAVFVAGLEMVRRGILDIQQKQPHDQIMIRTI